MVVKHKKEYFENLIIATQNLFGISVSLIFQISMQRVESLLKNKKIAAVLNYFDSVTDSLDLFPWSTQINNENTDPFQNILKRFHIHQSSFKITQLAKEAVEGLPSNNATAGVIPIKILKQSGITFEYLTCCINEAIYTSKFLFYKTVKYSICPQEERSS